MTTLEDLWYGNVDPHEQFLDGNEKLRELLPIMSNDRKNSQPIFHRSKRNGLISTMTL